MSKLASGNARARAVAQTAINSTLKRSKPKAVRAVRAQVALPRAYVDERMREIPATKDRLEGRLGTPKRDALQAQIDAAAAAAAASSVPAHHLRRALRAAGMLTAVKSYMDALPEDDEMRESWEYAPYFRRDAVGIEAARVALGLTAAQVDALFVAAGHVVT